MSPPSAVRQIAGYARRSLTKRTTNSVAKWAASAALPPLPQTSILFPAYKHCSIRSAAFPICASRSMSDCSVSFAPAIALFKISDEWRIRRQYFVTRIPWRKISASRPIVNKSRGRVQGVVIELISRALRSLSVDQSLRRDRECVTVVWAKANCVVFLDRVFHASCSPFFTSQIFFPVRKFLGTSLTSFRRTVECVSTVKHSTSHPTFLAAVLWRRCSHSYRTPRI